MHNTDMMLLFLAYRLSFSCACEPEHKSKTIQVWTHLRTGYKQIPLNMEHRGKQTKHTRRRSIIQIQGEKMRGIPFYLGSARLLLKGVELRRILNHSGANIERGMCAEVEQD